VTTNGEQRRAPKSGWLACSVSLGELVVLLIFTFALSRYWLMLPVWMRRTAGGFLFLAFAIVAYRLFRFFRKGAELKAGQPDSKESSKAGS
jgi:hypothetical protein